MAGHGNGGKNLGKKYNTLGRQEEEAKKKLEMSTTTSSSKSDIKFDINKIKSIVDADKKRANLKDPKIEAAKAKVKVEYENFDTEEETKAKQEKEDKEKAEAEKEKAKSQADKDAELWQGFNGEMIILAMEELNQKVIPKLCQRMKRQTPAKNMMLYSDTQKQLMRPSADLMMLTFIRMLKHPMYAFIGVAGLHMMTIAFTSPKLEDPKFNISEPEEPEEAKVA